jgi:hypothetical protein
MAGHLAQVHPDGIVGLVEGARREVEFDLLATVALHALALAVGFLRVDEVDARIAKGSEELLEVVWRRGEIRREQIVDLVVQ